MSGSDQRMSGPEDPYILNGSDGDGTTISATMYSDEINNPGDGFCLVYEFNTAGTGSTNLVATLSLEVWGGDTIGWVTDSLATFPAHPAGVLMQNTVTNWHVRGRKYRVKITVASGDGLGLIFLSL